MNKVLRAYWPLLLILLVCSILFTFQLNRDLLIDWDECVYGQQAKEMLATGNYITNQWNRELVFEKPPLYNWLTVPFYALFGVSPFTARIPMVLMSLALIASIYIFAKKYFNDRVAVLSSVLLLASNLPLTYMIRNNTDIGVALCIFLGFWAWIESFKKSNYSYLAGFLFGCGVMMKGLGVLPYIGTLFFTIFFQYKTEYLFNYAKMFSIFLVTILPWHVYHYAQFGQAFIQVYIIEHIIKRSQNTLDFHFEGRLFYVKLFIKSFGPWLVFTAVLPALYLLNFKRYFSKKSLLKELSDKRIIFIIILLILLPLISITRVKTRIEWYSLPIYPFLSIFIAYSLDLLFNKPKLRIITWIITAVIATQAVYLVSQKTRFWDNKRTMTPAQQFLLEAKKIPEDSINYLVWHGERKAEAILPQNMRTSTTFVYGGQPCAVYFTDKKINYYYDRVKFTELLKTQQGIFMVENSDLELYESIPGEVIFKNTDYTLFRKN